MREIKIKPEVGRLYRFREDNREMLLKKYGFYYSGLLMCLKEDVENLNDKPLTIEEYASKHNLLYEFEVYKCIQYSAQTELFDKREEHINLPLYLTLYEVNDMIEETHGKQS